MPGRQLRLALGKFFPDATFLILLALVAYHLRNSFLFLWGTFYQDPAGHFHFTLFDDAMISMRYALNLTRGVGLVWNPGEHVEGYTNPLWTLYMSALIFLSGKSIAPLLVQLSGFALISVSAVFCFLSARMLARGSDRTKTIIGLIALVGFLSYYPLYYWSLLGMEVSLLSLASSAALYFSISFFRRPHAKQIRRLLACMLLAYFARPDGWIALSPLLAVCIYRAVLSGNWRQYLRACLPVVAAAIALAGAHLAWRWQFYGTLVPNTYVLKVEGHPLALRLQNGMVFITPFLRTASLAIVLALLSLLTVRRQYRPLYIAIVAVPLIAVVYQLYVGGDPWPRWRQMTPTFFFFSLAAVTGILSRQRLDTPRGKLAAGLFLAAFALGVVFLPNKQFQREARFEELPFGVEISIKRVKQGLALNEVMAPGGSIMVMWAGSIPYFSDRYAIDSLGKADAFVARLPPDLSVSWEGLKGVPGHDKHDLAYSLAGKSPDYVQGWWWFSDDESSFVQQHYVAVRYGEMTMCLLKDSRFVRWQRVTILGDCVAEHASNLDDDLLREAVAKSAAAPFDPTRAASSRF